MGTCVQVKGTAMVIATNTGTAVPRRSTAGRKLYHLFLSKAKPAALQHSGDELVSRETQAISSRSCCTRDRGTGRRPQL